MGSPWGSPESTLTRAKVGSCCYLHSAPPPCPPDMAPSFRGPFQALTPFTSHCRNSTLYALM